MAAVEAREVSAELTPRLSWRRRVARRPRDRKHGLPGSGSSAIVTAPRGRKAPPRGCFGRLESPTQGPVDRDAITVAGWALFETRPVARVEVLLDGEPMGTARIGLPRPDVAQAMREPPEAVVAGFEWVLLRPGALSGRDQLTLEVRVTSTAGDSFSLVPSRRSRSQVAERAPSAASGAPRAVPPPRARLPRRGSHGPH